VVLEMPWRIWLHISQHAHAIQRQRLYDAHMLNAQTLNVRGSNAFQGNSGVVGWDGRLHIPHRAKLAKEVEELFGRYVVAIARVRTPNGTAGPQTMGLGYTSDS
jgi:hypothetical protein